MSEDQNRTEQEALERLAVEDGENPQMRERVAELERTAKLQVHLARRIIPNNPLPEGFINPSCGKPGHYCVDNAGVYRPEFKQIIVPKVHDYQQDPQPVGCADNTYNVPLDIWVDVPPEVVIVMNDAVETHHEHNPKPGDILLGVPTVHKETKRQRFMLSVLPSAT